MKIIQEKHYPKILARCPQKIRYITVGQLWIAWKLGLYQTVLTYSRYVLIDTRYTILIKTISELNRFVLNNADAELSIYRILSDTKFKDYQQAFIQEISQNYSELIFDYLEKFDNLLEQEYFLGLYLAILARKNLTDFEQQYYEVKKNKIVNVSDFTNRQCLINNLHLKTNIDKINNLNVILKSFNLQTLSLKNSSEGFVPTNLAYYPLYKNDIYDKNHKVTIIMTTYNASQTIQASLTSLLQQTWQNLQIIVVDDNSSDDTVTIVKAIMKTNNRILLIELPKNIGTFSAKSIGVMYATGDFLTCQDADDYAHPQKIELQVLPLIQNKNIIASTSYWVRIDKEGNYYARKIYPYLRHNPASPMFRLQEIKTKVGLWHLVRTGADSEFFNRLVTIFGQQRIYKIKKPLTFASHRENSLMTSKEYGAYETSSALSRLDYWEAWRLWHIDTLAKKQKIYMPDLFEQISPNFQQLFNIPKKIQINQQDVLYCLSHLQLFQNHQQVTFNQMRT